MSNWMYSIFTYSLQTGEPYVIIPWYLYVDKLKSDPKYKSNIDNDNSMIPIHVPNHKICEVLYNGAGR